MNTYRERRRSSGGWILGAVRGFGLAACGFGYLLAIIAGLALVADRVGAL